MVVLIPRRRRAVGMSSAALALALALGLPVTGLAAPGAPPPSAIAQYIEAVPTGGGDVATGATGGRMLPRSLDQKIDRLGGPDAAALKKVVSSAAYGAPRGQSMRALPHVGATTVSPSAPVSGAAFSAAAGTVTDVGSSTLTLLLAAVVAISLVGAGVAVGRRTRPARRGRG